MNWEILLHLELGLQQYAQSSELEDLALTTIKPHHVSNGSDILSEPLISDEPC